MAFPLTTVLTAAPGLISAATEIIRVIKDRKNTDPDPDIDKFEEMSGLIERQALVIEELALNNKNLVMEVKKNRILSLTSMLIAVFALLLAIWI